MLCKAIKPLLRDRPGNAMKERRRLREIRSGGTERRDAARRTRTEGMRKWGEQEKREQEETDNRRTTRRKRRRRGRSKRQAARPRDELRRFIPAVWINVSNTPPDRTQASRRRQLIPSSAAALVLTSTTSTNPFSNHSVGGNMICEMCISATGQSGPPLTPALADYDMIFLLNGKPPGTFSVLANGMTGCSGHIQYVNVPQRRRITHSASASMNDNVNDNCPQFLLLFLLRFAAVAILSAAHRLQVSSPTMTCEHAQGCKRRPVRVLLVVRAKCDTVIAVTHRSVLQSDQGFKETKVWRCGVILHIICQIFA